MPQYHEISVALTSRGCCMNTVNRHLTYKLYIVEQQWVKPLLEQISSFCKIEAIIESEANPTVNINKIPVYKKIHV